jgi:ABC-type lipoprotein export system ATPase subunit
MTATGNGSAPLVHCEGVSRTYGSGPTATVALQPTTCTIPPAARIALVGPSGSGKSTLLHLMAGLDDPTLGTVSWPAIGNHDVLRPGPVAVIFQGPSLLPPLTIEENVALPLVLGGSTAEDAGAAAREALALVGVVDIAAKLPDEISGGQAQRVAVARALAGAPRLILADEPTGQLDQASGAGVIDVLLAAAGHAGAGLVISTHDPAVAGRLPDVWTMDGGHLTATGGIPTTETTCSH